MSVQGSVVVDAGNGNKTLVHEAMSSLMRAANSWAHMTRAGAEGWAENRGIGRIVVLSTHDIVYCKVNLLSHFKRYE